MIKLITQFDNKKTKLSLATPTCGGCCCCCCIVSTFATASISARSFGDYVAEKLPNEPKKIKQARRVGFWLPIGLLISLVIGVRLFGNLELNIFIVPITIIIAYLFIMTSVLKKKLNLPGITSMVIGSSILLGIFEVIGGYVEVFASMYLNLFYLIGAIIISSSLIESTFEKKYDNLENTNNADNINSVNIPNNQSIENIDNVQTMKDTDNLTNELVQKKTSSTVQIEKKRCPNCGTENAIDNKVCIFCSNYFKTDDEK